MSEFTPELYHQHLQQKYHQTLEEFAEFGVTELDVFASEPQGYRMRAEFKAWHEDNGVAYAMFRPGTRQVYIVDDFPPGSARIQALMPVLRNALNDDDLLRHKLFQIEFLTTTTGDALVTLIYHRLLTDVWLARAADLAQRLNIQIVGRSRNQKLIVDRDYVLEEFSVVGRKFTYQQLEASFTQPNAKVCGDMLSWAVQQSRDFGGDLLELYCGNGNFTLPMSLNFGKVLATEVAKSSIQSAHRNCELNQVDNIDFVRMSSEDITGAFNQIRAYERLKQINLADYCFSTVFVDPPRAGLDPATNAFIQRFTNIVYISCNPETLKENLKMLDESHKVMRMALFDQFPFTEHRECGVILQRRYAEAGA